MAVQSFGSGLKSHVHFHILVSDGVYFPDGSYEGLPPGGLLGWGWTWRDVRLGGWGSLLIATGSLFPFEKNGP